MTRKIHPEGFALRLQELLLGANMSQAELSRATKVSPATIQRYLRCKSTPTWVHLATLARIFGVREEWLCYGEEPKRSEPGKAPPKVESPPAEASPAPVSTNEIMAPVVDRGKIINQVMAVLESGRPGIVNALVRNVEEFARAVENADALDGCVRQIRELSQEVKSLKVEVEIIKKPPTPEGADESSEDLAI